MNCNQELLRRKLKEKHSLIAVHRGSSGGNIIENTLTGFKAATLQGADILEIDVIKSTDGHFYCFHDGNEFRLFGEAVDICTMSSNEITQLRYRNSIFKKIDYGVEPLESAITKTNPETLINIDRAWDILEDILPFLDQLHVENRIIIKTPVNEEYLDILEKHPVNYMFMPIVHNLEELKLVKNFSGLNLIGFELIARTKDSELSTPKLIQQLQAEGYLIWANSIVLDDQTILFSGLDDNISIEKDPKLGWGKLFDNHIDIIQTDWPAILYAYRQKYFK